MRAIFIGGCGRSGTTLLAALLGAHPRVVSLPESQFIREYLQTGSALTPAERSVLAAAFRTHPRYAAWAELGCTGPERSPGGSRYSDLVQAFVAELAMRTGRSAPSHFVEHSPQNVLAFAELAAAFDDSLVIHLVREGRAVAQSVLPLDWGPDTILQSAPWWSRWVSLGLAAQALATVPNMITLRYEDLVRAPEATLRVLCDRAELDFAPAMLRGDGIRLPGYTRAQHRLVGRPPDPSRIDAWAEALSPRQIELFEHAAGPLLTRLGYPLRTAGLARGPTVPERIGAGIKGAGLRWVRRRRFRRRHSVPAGAAPVSGVPQTAP